MNSPKRLILLSLAVFVFALTSCVQNIPLSDNLFKTNEVDKFVQSLVGKSSAEQSEIASAIWSDSSKSLKLRDRATYVLASRNNRHTKVAQSSLNTQYYQSSSEYRKYMEETLFHDLSTASDADITANLKLITPNLEPRFPYNLIIFAAAKRGLLANSQKVLDTFKTNSYFQSPAITLEKAPSTNYVTAKSGSVAMLLPQSGSYSTFSRQIMTGAKMAQSLLQQQGIQWNITYIDTQDPNWQSYLNNLPKDCVVVGGPLQANIYKSLQVSGITAQRAFFTFLTRLPEPSSEGTDAWRFFTSPDDQINAVLNVAQRDLGIRSFGSFYQNNAYGKGMNNLFVQKARERGLAVFSMEYPANDIKNLNSLTQKFLDTKTPEKGKLPIAKRPIDAIFFPDVWKNMDMLISYMHYHGGHKKIMLGTSLWEQSLNTPVNINPQTFALTLFPVAYDSHRESPYKEYFQKELDRQHSIGTDWIALGFDFVLMSSRLQLEERKTSSEINRMLSSLKVDYISAPFVYAPNGTLTRELIINQPARNGRMPYNKDAFMTYRKDGKDLPNLDEATKEKQEKQQEENALDDLIQSILN